MSRVIVYNHFRDAASAATAVQALSAAGFRNSCIVSGWLMGYGTMWDTLVTQQILSKSQANDIFRYLGHSLIVLLVPADDTDAANVQDILSSAV